MAITTEIVEAVLPQIITEDIRASLICGIENGINLHETLNEMNREQLGVYAGNIQTRNLFSCLCAQLEAVCSWNKHIETSSHRKTSSIFVEIQTEHMLLHLRNEASAMPQYVKDNLKKYNTTFSLASMNYIQLVYKAEKGEVLKKADLVVMDENTHEVYREELAGSWNTNAKAS